MRVNELFCLAACGEGSLMRVNELFCLAACWECVPLLASMGIPGCNNAHTTSASSSQLLVRLHWNVVY